MAGFIYGGKMNSIYKRALRLAVPMMIQNGITNAVVLVDNIMVGSLGTEAMTAVSIVGQLMFVFNLAIFGGMSGPGIYGAQFFGQGNNEGFRGTFRLKHWIGLFCLIFGILAFSFGSDFLIGLYLHGESEALDKALTIEQAHNYLDIMIFGMLPFVITQIYAGSLREAGDSINPMVGGIASVVVDIVLNYCLIYGNFGFPQLGVRGAAIATVAARVVEMLVVVIWANINRRHQRFLKGVYKTLLISRDMCRNMLKKGTPIFFNEFLWAAGIAALTQCYSIRGLEVVAGLNISNTICNMLNVVFVALGNAVGILTGQKLGASKYKEAQSEAFSLMKFTGIICVGLTVTLASIAGVFPRVYDTTEAVRNYGTGFIVITAVFFPVQGYLNALYFTLRSGGKTLVTFLFDSVFSWAVSLPTAIVLCYFSPLPILLVYAIIQALDIIKVIVGYILIKKGVWISNLVSE